MDLRNEKGTHWDTRPPEAGGLGSSCDPPVRPVAPWECMVQVLALIQFSANVYPGRQRVLIHVSESLSPLGASWTEPLGPGFGRCSPSYCGHLRNEPAVGRLKFVYISQAFK